MKPGASPELLFLFSETVKPLLSPDFFGIRTRFGVRFLSDGLIINFSVYDFLLFSTFYSKFNQNFKPKDLLKQAVKTIIYCFKK
jgi:hypothetical protein